MGSREIAHALFVTDKTVESQLGAVYRKLDIASRKKLPDVFADTPTSAAPILGWSCAHEASEHRRSRASRPVKW
jgi:hypothetical protein